MKSNRIDLITDAVAGIMTVLQPDEYLRLMSLILTCVSVTLSLAFTVYKWYKTAKSDGKITIDEYSDLVTELREHEDYIERKRGK